MKRTIYNVAVSFRCPNTLADALNELATLSNRHASSIIREAVFHYVEHCRQNPEYAKRY